MSRKRIVLEGNPLKRDNFWKVAILDNEDDTIELKYYNYLFNEEGFIFLNKKDLEKMLDLYKTT